MHKNRHRLRILYLALCSAQLVVMGLGLTVAYQVQQSYSRTIGYEHLVSEKSRLIDELRVLARVASPESLDLDDGSSGPIQLSQINYAANIFLKKTQELKNEAAADANSPLAMSAPDLKQLSLQMQMVQTQSRLAGEAWEQHNDALARARLTYASRAASQLQTILDNISQEMGRAKDDSMALENVEERSTHLFLRPLAVIGILLIFPAMLYAKGLDRKIWEYEAQLEKERTLLEDRVTQRTAELRTEIESRKRIEAFNSSRNRLLERIAEGDQLERVLAQLVEVAEESVPGGRCVVIVSDNRERPSVACNVSVDITEDLEALLMGMADGEVGRRQCAFFAPNRPASIHGLAAVWSAGYQGVLTVPIRAGEGMLLGMIALLLRDNAKDPGGFEREVLLSAERVASIALGHQRMQDELFRRAHYDSLTGLPNRSLFEDRLQQAVALAQRRRSNLGVLCIDLDGFKQVNDEYGHQAGDMLLQEVAQRLKHRLRATDTMARQGGDEFVAILHETLGGEGIAKVSDMLVSSLAEPYVFGNLTLRLTASIGAAVFPADGPSSEDLRRNADLAMYRAKERGGNTFQIFSAEIAERLARRKQLEQYLQEGLDRGDGFELHYQPIFTVERKLMGLEALIRFRSPDLKSISPAEFIRVAEQTGQIMQIGEWVVREACRQARQWHDTKILFVPIAVNVSAVQLARPKFASAMGRIVRESGVEPGCIHIEITETAIMSDFDEGRRQLYELADMGFHISIDDFGTGQSSLSYIHRLPIQTIKIDRSFVQQLANSQESEAIVRAIIAMAQSLELSVIAEGVETEEQFQAVARAGCNAAQGYLFSKPLNAPAAMHLLSGTSMPTHSTELTTSDVS